MVQVELMFRNFFRELRDMFIFHVITFKKENQVRHQNLASSQINLSVEQLNKAAAVMHFTFWRIIKLRITRPGRAERQLKKNC